MEKIENKQKVLVVEDDPPVLLALVDKLTREGFHVFEAKNGKDGFTTALKERPDLILLDLLMPVMDGSTMLTKLRQENAWGKAVPVMMLTNLSTAEIETIKAVIEAEPVYYLVKTNWSMADVMDRVRETLGRKK